MIEGLVQEQLLSASQNATTNTPPTPVAPEPVPMEITTEQAKTEEPIADPKLTINNPCVLCGREEKRLACIPCGHFVSCTNCSQTLRTCPVCGRGIEAFVRIYI